MLGRGTVGDQTRRVVWQSNEKSHFGDQISRRTSVVQKSETKTGMADVFFGAALCRMTYSL